MASGTFMSRRSIVIIGAGHAGVQAAASLREEGSDDSIVLVSGEPDLPYQRPPLSKAFLKGAMDLAGLPLRAEQFYREKQIDLRLGVPATRIDLAARRVELGENGAEPFDHLILATGARSRPFAIPGADLDGVLTLRNIADAAAIRERLGPGRRVVVIGAGFIGLEIAATALAGGGEVTVVEIARPLGRAVSPSTSDFFLDAHQAFGARFRLGVGVNAIEGAKGAAAAVVLADGERAPADLVIVGVGVLAEDALARAAGLACDNGVVVDALLAASDPAVSAIGDCAQFPQHSLGQMLRLESVQNATDQARAVARRLTGRPAPYAALPWFWSDQGDLKLQIAGLPHGVDRWVLRGDPKDRAFAAFGFRAGALATVETVNRGAEHMAARRIIGGALPISPEEAADPAFDLRKLALSAKA
jgi:3-phenylpropionate/trans-cinnamate dioxygenase ferredoxin reductase subunit